MPDGYWKIRKLINRLLSILSPSHDPEEKSKVSQKDDVLRLLYDEFDTINRQHFNSSLKVPQIEFSTRKTFGGYYQATRHRIVLSWQAYVEHGMDETLNTFRHEVAHIVHQNHQVQFWQLAAQLGVTRRYAASPLAPTRRRSRLYIYRCPSCAGEVHRKRRLRVNSSCANCDTKYNPAYQLKLINSVLK